MFQPGLDLLTVTSEAATSETVFYLPSNLFWGALYCTGVPRRGCPLYGCTAVTQTVPTMDGFLGKEESADHYRRSISEVLLTGTPYTDYISYRYIYTLLTNNLIRISSIIVLTLATKHSTGVDRRAVTVLAALYS